MQRVRAFESVEGATPSPLAIRELVGKKVDLWYMRSPKNNCRFVLSGEPLYLLAITLEANQQVRSYSPCGTDENPDNLDTLVPQLCSEDLAGAITKYYTVRLRGSKPRRSKFQDVAEKDGIRIITDEWLYDQRILIDNWIFLCAAINRVRNSHLFGEVDVLAAAVSRSRSWSLGELLALPDIDKAKILGLVASMLQSGTAFFNTASEPLTRNSVIRFGEQ
ncbi:hypothetical protein [Duganella qianjiadongensis]|uniref:Uncharacterized protein n=1 Tax=Duganella qianjiadongensis TaxID=2692176 RepID=A0ABW9VML8_9BURK|nr:hypothetical protein [Duganella qianjiadongensis]MYM39684.1 hypothetical protein [Duganella qianjiadongensis]